MKLGLPFYSKSR